MRAEIVRFTKEPGVSITGIGLRIAKEVTVGQHVDPDLGGGRVSKIEVDGPLILIYKENADGTPCRTFGNGLTGEGLAVPVHFAKSFIFTNRQGPAKAQAETTKGK